MAGREVDRVGGLIDDGEVINDIKVFDSDAEDCEPAPVEAEIAVSN